MPIYDYVCSECSHQFEENNLICERDIPNKAPCPSCGKDGTVERYLGNNKVSVKVLPSKDKRDAFNTTLKRIKKFHKGSTIND